jgi:hypothetical protein
MTPWGLKPALLVATCCATASGSASGQAAQVPAYSDVASYLAARARLVDGERARRPSSALPLSPEEEAADRRLAVLRRAELERVGPYLPPAHSFLLDETRRLIEESPLLGVMRRLPKGGILHVHGSAGGDLHWLVAHATYRPDCYVFQGGEDPVVRGTLRIFPRPPEGDWHRVVDLRRAAPDPRAFDEELYRSITLGPEDREAPDIWREFVNCFRRGWDLFDDQGVRGEEILSARREAEGRGFSLPLFLHSGETSRAQSENLYDAVLLGAHRIGHGLALVRHPLLMDIARERGIAVEVCTISNQVLGYVSDLRAHPAVAYLNSGIPVVLSPDDPGVMRHTLSHDFYEAFMAWELDLRGLKHLAMSSLVHSAMAPDEKQRALASWEKRWAVFVRWLNEAGDAPPGNR